MCWWPPFEMICGQFSRGKRSIRTRGKYSIKPGFGGNRGSLLAAGRSYHRERGGEQNRYSVRRQPILRRHGVLANCTSALPPGLLNLITANFASAKRSPTFVYSHFVRAFEPATTAVRSRKGLAQRRRRFRHTLLSSASLCPD